VGDHALAGGVEAPVVLLAVSGMSEKPFVLTFESWSRARCGGGCRGSHRS